MTNLSIIISTYNRSVLCEKAIDSVIPNNQENEVIVIDNGTQSTTKEMVQDLRLRFGNLKNRVY